MPSLAANGTGTAFTYDAVYTLTNDTGTAFTSGTTITNTATYDQTWTTCTSSITLGSIWPPAPVPREWFERATERVDSELRRREAEAAALRCQEEHGARVAARERAEALLNSVLTPAQRESWALHRWFEMVGSQGGRYRIGYGRVRNITRLDERGRGVETLCIHPDADVPDADTVAAQKLYLESDEAALLRTANHMPVAA